VEAARRPSGFSAATATAGNRRLATESLVSALASCALVWAFWSLPVTANGIGSLTSARQLAELDLSGVIPIDTPVLLAAYLLPVQALLGLMWIVLGGRLRTVCGLTQVVLAVGLAAAAFLIARAGVALGPMWVVSLLSAATTVCLVVHDLASKSGRTLR